VPLDERPPLDYYEWVVFFGLYDHLTRSVNHFYSSPEDAEADLRRILIDEPTWSGTLTVVSLDFSGPSVAVRAVPRRRSRKGPS
jgi:uncharacterized membrane protein YjjP (DUF1212 family)